MKKNLIFTLTVLIALVLSILIAFALLKKAPSSPRQESGLENYSKEQSAIFKRNTARKNISQKPSGPADLKSIAPEHLEEPKAGAGEVTLDKDDKPVVDAKGNPVLK